MKRFSGSTIRELRLKAGLSQEDLGSKLNVVQMTISNWENGKSQPKQQQKAKLQKILGFNTKDANVADASPLAAWVSKARIVNNFSVPELASKTGVTPAAIYRIEKGITRNLQASTLHKLTKILGDPPKGMREEVIAESSIKGLGSLEDFDPHATEDLPAEPGIYVFYDISERPIYVGEGGNIKRRILQHTEKFWFKPPIVQFASWIRVPDDTLRKQIEEILIKFLKSNAVINKQHVER